MKYTKNIILGILAVIAVYALVSLVMDTKSGTGTNNGSGPIACTADAMQCPDGSYVGRTGPNCQFVCPTSVATSTPKSPVSIEVHLNQKVDVEGETITPLLVLQDSRCPSDVQCIQAGTVRVSTTLQSGVRTLTQVFVLGTPVTLGTEEITLTDVKPVKNSKIIIKSTDYLFTFRVVKK
jgi:hypothetical protein